MCGIAGAFNLSQARPIRVEEIRQMLAMIRHRGPDQFGIYLDDEVGLGSARLSIIDLNTGQQPIANEDGTLWIVFNGEVFNYVELRPELEARGHRFTTETDTEVVLHMYEEFGPACLHKLNGQFALAIWNAKERSLFLARDRMGIRPLFYTQAEGTLLFGSEIKVLLTDDRVAREMDAVALDQIFTFWSTLSPRTIFRGIVELPPGHYLLARPGKVEVQKYWELKFPSASDGIGKIKPQALEDYLDEFRSLLIDAARIRLRADVPVGAYLSGGLDSSTIAAIVRKYASNHLDTFSISFSNPRFDESKYQREMAKFLGTDHQVVYATDADIGRVFPEVLWHTETPILRTAPVPMFLLSKLVRENRFKVVLTGEGADEVLAGYDIFKEAKIRRFWAQNPDSRLRPLLLKRLYPDIDLSKQSNAFLAAFFREGLMDLNAPDYSHAVRWRNTRRTRRFFSDEVLAEVAKNVPTEGHGIAYPPEFMSWGPLERAQYLESTIFLSQYLLSSQGDRVAMAHAVEGRFPFLDYRVVEFCSRLPSNLKLRGLTEKYLLKKLGGELLPPQIWQRKKRPYRAPIHRSFFNEATPEYVRELLSEKQIAAAGFFKAGAVAQLVKKIERGLPIGETDDMALAGVLSTQLVHQQFVADFKMPPPLSDKEDVKVCLGQSIAK